MLLEIYNLLLIEWRKQTRLKLPYFGLLGSALMAIIWPYTLGIYSGSPGNTAYTLGPDTMKSIVGMWAPVLGCIFAATLVAPETAHRTNLYVLARPVRRLSYLAAKCVTAYAYAVALLFVGAVANVLVVATTIGFEQPLDAPEMNPTVYWALFAGACVLTLLPLFATMAFGLFCSILFRHTGPAVGVSVGFLTALEPLKALITRIESDLDIWSHLPIPDYFSSKMLIWSHHFSFFFEVARTYGRGLPGFWVTWENSFAITVPLAWILLFTAASYWIVRRRDWG